MLRRRSFLAAMLGAAAAPAIVPFTHLMRPRAIVLPGDDDWPDFINQQPSRVDRARIRHVQETIYGMKPPGRLRLMDAEGKMLVIVPLVALGAAERGKLSMHGDGLILRSGLAETFSLIMDGEHGAKHVLSGAAEEVFNFENGSRQLTVGGDLHITHFNITGAVGDA